MTRKTFKAKDALILLGFYFAGVQFLIPVIVTFPVMIAFSNQMQTLPHEEFMNLVLGPINFFTMLIGTLIVSFFYRAQLYDAWLRFKENVVKNVVRVVQLYGFQMIASIAINLVFIYLFKIEDTSANQEMVETLVNNMPVLMAMNTILFAPILEEVVFRGGLFIGIQEKLGSKIAIIISSVSFGAIHVMAEFFATGNLQELLFLIPYSAMGYFMVRAVKDTDSLFGGILIHFINNFVATVLVMFM